MALTIRSESETDFPTIRALVSDAFGGSAEARLIERLREEGAVAVSLVAVERNTIVGSVVLSRLAIVTEDSTIHAAALAPLAVRRDRRRSGIGSALVHEGLRICEERGIEAVLVLGDPLYYRRFGFSAERATGISSAYSGPSFMVIEFAPSKAGISGLVTYPAAFAEVE